MLGSSGEGSRLSTDPLPLAAARERLRRRPGRPRKVLAPEEQAAGELARRARIAAKAAPVSPRLLDVDQAGAYLGVSPWTIRDMIAAGRLPRVRLPGTGDRDCRRLLLDREDLDRLIAASKETSA